MDSLVEGTLEWAPLREDDLVALAELRQAIEYFDDPVERLGLEDLFDQFNEPGAAPGDNAVVGRDRGGTIVAYGWNLVRGMETGEPRVWLDGGVHPAWRHKSIGGRIVEWQLDRAREWHDELRAAEALTGRLLWVGAYVDAANQARHALFVGHGFAPSRWYFDMHCPLVDDEGNPTPSPELPPLGSVQLRPYHPGLAEAVRLAHNEAFATTAGAHRVGRAAWEHSLARSAARPEWSWVALEGDVVVGYAMNSAYVADWEPQGFSEGWTDRLGVHPAWRGRGIGPALLVASMGSFREAGLQAAGIGVDTERPDGPVRSFERIGYVRDDMVVLMVREFPADDGSDSMTHAVGPGGLARDESTKG